MIAVKYEINAQTTYHLVDDQGSAFLWILFVFMFYVCLYYTVWSVPYSLVITFREMIDLWALLCVIVSLCSCHFPILCLGLGVVLDYIDYWPRGYKTWVHFQTQNKVQWLDACGHVSASNRSLCFILSFITAGPNPYICELKFLKYVLVHFVCRNWRRQIRLKSLWKFVENNRKYCHRVSEVSLGDHPYTLPHTLPSTRRPSPLVNRRL